MKKIRCAVIGVGYLGRFHAQKYQHSPHVDLVAVCDQQSTIAHAVAEELHVPCYTDYRALFGKVDAVSIAAPTLQHYTIARDCIEQGIHVLVEKPITQTVAEAQTLITLAKQHGVKLQVGHLERFNAARLALEPYLEKPLFIESNRLAPFTPRGADVNVVLDLMIHDIDLIQTMVKSPIKSIEAQGAPVLSQAIDIANARITFENLCIANVTASRVSFKKERKMRIFQTKNYLSLDYQDKKLMVLTKGSDELFPGIPGIDRHESVFTSGDALQTEIDAFVQCIVDNTSPLVPGEDGLAALETAARITHCIEQHLLAHDVSL
jgi:predicted dehydrogenase